MTRSLPTTPGYASLRRIDWRISLAFRMYRSEPGATTSSGSIRARTRCWVIVDAPRSLSPLSVLGDCRQIACGSKPGFSQNVRSSAVVVVKDQPGHIVVGDDPWLDGLETTQLDLAVTVIEDRWLGERQRFELGRVRQVLGQVGHRG